MRLIPSGLLLSVALSCLAATAEAQDTTTNTGTTTSAGTTAPAGNAATGGTGNGNAAGLNPATQQAAPGVPAAHELNTSDRVFLRAAATGGMAEVDFAQLASGAGSSNLVKDFARRMADDHGKANKRLTTLANGDQFPLPTKLDNEHQSVREALQKLKGAEFDHRYIDSQLQDHQRTAQLLEYEIGSGENADLKTFAEENLPIVLEHLQMAQDIATKLWGVGPQGAAPGLAELQH